MSEAAFHNLPIPRLLLMIEGSIFAGVYLAALLFCLKKLWIARGMQRFTKVILSLCCATLCLEGFFWLDYYTNYPDWLFGLLMLLPKSLEVSVIERLAASWTVAYNKYMSFTQTTPYNDSVVRVSLVTSVLLQLMFLALFLCIYVGRDADFMLGVRIFIVTVEAVAVPYLMISAYRLNKIIRQYLAPIYSRKITIITCLTSGCLAIRLLIGLVFIIMGKRDFASFEEQSLYWLLVVVFQLYAVAAIAFILTVSTLIVVQRRGSEEERSDVDVMEDLSRRYSTFVGRSMLSQFSVTDSSLKELA
jgi:hypothetical protein